MAKEAMCVPNEGHSQDFKQAPIYTDRANANAKLLEEASMIAFQSRDR